MHKKKYKQVKQDKRLYHNKVFSYNRTTLIDRNYSRKNFANTHTKLVVFKNCKFNQTIFSQVKFENCLFENCEFKGFEFSKVLFYDITFKNCCFQDILFNKCSFHSVIAVNSGYLNVSIVPYYKIFGMDVMETANKEISSKLEIVLENAKLQKYLRESNTLFKKHHNKWSNKTKKELKKISKKDGDKIGLTTKQRLQENARRKKLRNKMLRESYEKSQKGENRIIDNGVLQFLLMIYSDEELINGLNYAISNINFSFHELSYLLKYIDKANNIR